MCASAVCPYKKPAAFPHQQAAAHRIPPTPPCPLPPAPTIREALAEHASDIVYVPSGANYLAHQTSVSGCVRECEWVCEGVR